MKTLQTIQTISKIAKVLSKLVSVCCIVGVCGCAAGAAAMLVGAETIKLGGVTLHSILQTEAGVSEGTVWAAIAAGVILCSGEYFLARMAQRCFANELAAGTPFTLDGAKELMHLGISAIWIPIVTATLAQVAQGVIGQAVGGAEKLSVDGFGGVMPGVMLIFVSLLCRYGAEMGQEEAE